MNELMEVIKKIAKFIIVYWVQIVCILWIIEHFWGIVVKKTPWQWDDKIHTGYRKFIEKFFPKGSKKPPFLLRMLLKCTSRGEIPFWLKILVHLRFGKFKTPSGIEYNGFKVSFKW